MGTLFNPSESLDRIQHIAWLAVFPEFKSTGFKQQVTTKIDGTHWYIMPTVFTQKLHVYMNYNCNIKSYRMGWIEWAYILEDASNI